MAVGTSGVANIAYSGDALAKAMVLQAKVHPDFQDRYLPHVFGSLEELGLMAKGANPQKVASLESFAAAATFALTPNDITGAVRR
ncbi:MAG: hypothetical protein ACKVOE_09505 [Rickettsiales bacterium]